MQHGRVAPAVEQHHALLAARHAFGDGLQQRRAEHGAPGLLVHVHPAHAGQGARADAAGHVQPQVAAAFGVFGRGRAAGVPAFQRWRGGAQQHLGTLLAPAPDGQVARRVAGPFLLLVAGVVLFIDHDELEPWQAGKHRHARAQHDARGAAVRGQPAFEALRVGHAAVQRHHRARAKARRKAADEAFFQLGREVDLGHHHQRLGGGVGFQHFLHAAQVHLGLAAAGAAKQQKGAWVGGNLGSGAFLFSGKCYVFNSVARIICGQGRAAQAPCELLGLEVAQLGRQGGQCHLAQGPLVIARREGHQAAPGQIQRRHAFQHPADGAQGGAVGQLAGGGIAVPHHAQHLAVSQGNAHQRAGRQGPVAGIAQQITHAAV